MADTNGASSNGGPPRGAFPDLVMDIGPSTQRAASSFTSPLAQKVENRLREVLAWRPRSGDARSFVAALNQAFTISEVNGHTEWEWTPRSYAIQADMGAVTGAQASIYARARAAFDQSRPLIEAVYPLRSDADHEDAESVRALVLSQWQQLVGELGRVGGPRLQRVDGLFQSLLGEEFGPNDDHEDIDGLLGVMERRFGFEEDRINRIDEEQNWTNFLILVDHTIGLLRSWTALRRYFDNEGSDVFLGTQLVLLSRALDVVAESVHGATMLMDSVFLSEGERQTVRLDSGLTIDDLLAWTEGFCSQEAKEIIRDAGKDGVVALQPTLNTLTDLVAQALEQARRSTRNPQAGFHTPRVQTALEELKLHLEEAAELASQIRRDALRVSAVFPASIDLGERTSFLTVDGNGFELGASVRLTRLNGQPQVVAAEGATVLSATRLLAGLDPQGLEPGEWNVIVTNPDGVESEPHGLLLVTGAAPEAPRQVRVLNVDEDHGAPGEELIVTVFGAGFGAEAQADFGPGIGTKTSFVDEHTLEVFVAIDAAAEPGARTVTVSHPSFRPAAPAAGGRGPAAVPTDGPFGSLEGGFTVDEPTSPPDEDDFELFPARAVQGDEQEIRISSRGETTFAEDAEVSFGPGIVAFSNAKLRDERTLVVQIGVVPNAEPGLRDVRIVLDDEVIRLPDAFTVESSDFIERIVAVEVPVTPEPIVATEIPPPIERTIAVEKAELLNRTAIARGREGVKASLADFRGRQPMRVRKNQGVDSLAFSFDADLDPTVDWSRAVTVTRAGEDAPLALDFALSGSRLELVQPEGNFEPGIYIVRMDPQRIRAADGVGLAEKMELVFVVGQ